MRILGHAKLIEKGVGFLHTVTIETDAGAIVTIEDDTRRLTVFSSKEDAITLDEINVLRTTWGMGGSEFPAVPMPKAEPTPWASLEFEILLDEDTATL